MKLDLKNIGLSAALLASQLLLGCLSQESQKTGTGPSNPGADQETGNAAKVRDYILSLGFDPKNIVSEGDKFIVEGDMVFDKNKDYGTPSTSGALAKTGQYYLATGVIQPSIIRNIRVRVDASMAGEEANVDNALLALNRSYSSIYFQRVSTANQHILISKVPNDTRDAYVYMSSGTSPSTDVFVGGLGVYWQESPVNRSLALLHELLHTVKFYHTREGNNGNPQVNTSPGGTQIPNTPDYVNPDPYSVMNPWNWIWDSQQPKQMDLDNGISYYDHKGIQFLYPYLNSMRSGDVNGDGKTDIILIKASDHSVTFRTSNGSGLNGAVSAGTFGDDLGQYMIGDINGDHKSDLLFAEGGTIMMRLSTGNGFAAPTTLITGFGSSALGGGQYQVLDFNGDGKSDVMFVNYMARSINVRLSNGTGLGSNITTNFGDGAGEYFVGDINGDNKDDILCANRPSNLASDPTSVGPHTVSIVYSNGTSYGASNELICGDCFGHISWGGMYLTGDYNNDGKDDIYFKDGAGNLFVALSTGNGIGQVISNYNVGSWTSTYFTGDFTGDGRTDVLSCDRSGGINLMKSNGTTAGSYSNLITIGFGNQSLGDIFL